MGGKRKRREGMQNPILGVLLEKDKRSSLSPSYNSTRRIGRWRKREGKNHTLQSGWGKKKKKRESHKYSYVWYSFKSRATYVAYELSISRYSFPIYWESPYHFLANGGRARRKHVNEVEMFAFLVPLSLSLRSEQSLSISMSQPGPNHPPSHQHSQSPAWLALHCPWPLQLSGQPSSEQCLPFQPAIQYNSKH